MQRLGASKVIASINDLIFPNIHCTMIYGNLAPKKLPTILRKGRNPSGPCKPQKTQSWEKGEVQLLGFTAVTIYGTLQKKTHHGGKVRILSEIVQAQL